MKVKYEIDTSSYQSQDERCKYQCYDSSTERIQTKETHGKLITYGNTLKSTKKAANTILKVKITSELTNKYISLEDHQLITFNYIQVGIQDQNRSSSFTHSIA